MKAIGVVFAGLAALAVMGGAEAANAQQARVRATPATPSANPAPDAYTVSERQGAQQPNQITPQTRRSTLRWDSVRGRWGLQLDMDQSPQRDVGWRDMQGGVTYSVTHSLRVAATAGADAQDQVAAPRNSNTPQGARVRLETAFRF